MRPATQGLLLAVLGAVLVRLSITDDYLRYVTPWMKWPLLVSGVILVGLAIGPILRVGREDEDHHGAAGNEDVAEELGAHDGQPHGHQHGVPMVTWLLVLPGVITFVVAPPALDSYLAERRAGEAAAVPEPAVVAPLSSSGPTRITVDEFIWRAQEGGSSMVEQEVRLTGFVSWGEDGQWYLTRMSIGCCAADAVAYRVEVRDAERPPRDQWVTVVGEHVPGTGTGRPGSGEVALAASAVELIDEPAQTYE